MKRKLVLLNEISEIGKLPDFVDAAAEEAALDPAMAMSLNLAIEEAVTNVISYAYPPGERGEVVLEADLQDGRLVFVLRDAGKPFDPTAQPLADITLGVEDRPIGGLGIFLVRQIMDAVEYRREQGENILVMTKKIV